MRARRSTAGAWLQAVVLVPWLGLALGVAFAAPPAATPEVQDASLRSPREGFTATVLSLTLQLPRDAELTAATLQGWQRVELHRMQRDGDTVQMVPVRSIPVSAGVPLRLRTAEGAYHLMAAGARRPVVAGQQPVLRLQFREGGSGRVFSVQAPVRVLPPRAGGHAHGGAHDEH